MTLVHGPKALVPEIRVHEKQQGIRRTSVIVGLEHVNQQIKSNKMDQVPQRSNQKETSDGLNNLLYTVKFWDILEARNSPKSGFTIPIVSKCYRFYQGHVIKPRHRRVIDGGCRDHV